jgi:hypothetical protein
MAGSRILPQNVAVWHSEYFKEFEKQQLQEGRNILTSENKGY